MFYQGNIWCWLIKKYDILLAEVGDGDLLQTKNLIPGNWSRQDVFESHWSRMAIELTFE